MEIDLEVLLAELELTMDQFIDLCIMCGCDYANNIRGIGAVRALSLMKQHGSIEAVVKVRLGRGGRGALLLYRRVRVRRAHCSSQQQHEPFAARSSRQSLC
jgi:5'-3' exonuclease